MITKNPKKRGEWVELQFMARAAAHGLTVSKPWGDSTRYDFIVEHSGQCRRVQVKSTAHQVEGGYLCHCTRRDKHGLGPYTSADVDFVAAYIIPEDLWYVIPIAELARVKTAIWLKPQHSRNRYNCFLEAWHLLRTQ